MANRRPLRSLRQLENRIEYRQRECIHLAEQLEDKQLNENQKRYRRQRKAGYEREIKQLQEMLKMKKSAPGPQRQPSFPAISENEKEQGLRCSTCSAWHEYCSTCGARYSFTSEPDLEHFTK
jgi:hypothetical protein